ncbi:peptidase M16 [Spirochaetia bacterium]|nr:peptidase M16 [Spirochaetia bacterium]
MANKTVFPDSAFIAKKSFRSAVFTAALAAFTFALVLTFSACTSSSARGDIYGGLGQGGDPVPFMANVRTGTLPNGLRYYILHNAKPENRAFLTLAVNAGSVLEQDDEQGLAHFVEHMAFNGTTRFPESELLNYLRSLGMRFGADVNAYTTFDSTVFGIEVPVETGADGLKRLPGTALDVIDDWSHAVTFAPADVDDERGVIMEEYRTRLGAGERVQRKTIPILLAGSPYARRLPIGLPEIIQSAPASRLQNFYKTWYRTDNMAIILVGDFDAAVLEAELAAHVTAAAPDTPLNRPFYELPPPEKGRLQVEIITDPEYPHTWIDAYYKGAPKPLKGDLASYRQGVIDVLIDRIVSTRFDEATDKPETPYSGAGAWENRWGRESRFYVLAAIAKPGNARESLRAIMLEKESIRRYGFTNAEIDRAKRSLVSDLMRMASEQDRQESNRYISEFTGHFLSGRNVADIEWELAAVTKLLPGISAKELAATAKAYFAADDLTLIVVAPDAEQANLPTEAEIRRIIADSRKARIARPRERVVKGELLDQKPEPGAIISKGRDDETGAIFWELDNGAKIILKETANKNNEIILYAMARGGSTVASEAEDISVKLAAEMASASGVGPYSRAELVQKLTDKQVSLSFSTAYFSRSLRGSSTTGDLKTLFELLYLTFTQPRIEGSAVQAMLDQYRTSLAQRSENPEAVFSDELNRTFYGDHYIFRPMEVASLERVDIGQARNFLTRALNPADYTFVFIGNLDLAALRSYAETYLASIPRGAAWNTFGDMKITRPGKLEKSVYKGKEEKSMVFMAWTKPETYNEQGQAAADVLTEYLDIKLTEEIREKLGGVYSVYAGASLSPLPPDGELMMQSFFECDPGRAPELADAVVKQLELIQAGTIDQDTFTKAKEALKKSHEESMQSNSNIAYNYINLSVILDAPLGLLDKRPGLYDAVTPVDIQNICRQLLPQGPMRIILYPEGAQ